MGFFPIQAANDKGDVTEPGFRLTNWARMGFAFLQPNQDEENARNCNPQPPKKQNVPASAAGRGQ
jgi:hypothetical protein